MKFGIALFATFGLVSGADAFSSAVKQSARVASVSLQEKIADELAIPCEEECALESFPNLPPSVHPGVVTGQAMVDLLNHAKENGKSTGRQVGIWRWRRRLCCVHHHSSHFPIIIYTRANRIRYPRSKLRVVIWNKCMSRGCTQKRRPHHHSVFIRWIPGEYLRDCSHTPNSLQS
jgi:hypothetical protein